MATGTMRGFFDLHHLARGEYLVRQGEDAEKLYFLESGQVTAWLAMPDGRRLRLRTMSAGNILGEIGWYLDISRSASVIADRDSVVLSLTHASLERMEREAPGLAMVFHAHVATILAERLFETDKVLQAAFE
jgi:SulP family sulfate permease